MRNPQSLAQKLIARAAGRPEVRVGEVVTCKVDLAMFHDSSGPRRLQPMLEQLGAQIWDKSRVVLVMDHYVPERSDDARRIVRIARDWAREQQLPHVYDSVGICHVVVPQHGHIRPGLFCVGGDSHSPTGGAFGAYMFGIGSTEMLGVVTTGEIWVQVPRTIRMRWDGRLAPGVSAKDMMLAMIGRFGMNGGAYQAIEFAGAAVRALPMHERMTLSNMSAELGSQVGLVAPDEVTRDWLAAHGAPGVDVAPWFSDEGSADEEHGFDASTLAPQVAAPFSPANAGPADRFADTKIQDAYIGACTGAKLEDLRFAAEVLRGRRKADNVKWAIVVPGSGLVKEQAEAEGLDKVFIEAGLEWREPGCSACLAMNPDKVPAGERCASTSNRNFTGRQGPGSRTHLVSPAMAAAAAVTGRLTDVRDLVAG